MKILVLSDSHSGLSFMRRAIRAVRPNAVIHLGDYYEDGMTMAEEFPNLIFHQVPGNCDLHRMPKWQHEILSYPIYGVPFYMTHGHRHGVKMSTGKLIADARASRAAAALYGHTHIPDCHQEEDGLWVLNPGSCGSSGGSVGLLEIDNGEITACRILRWDDLEEMR